MGYRKGEPRSEETKAKISAALKGVPKPRPMNRRKPSARQDYSQWIGRTHSPESIAKMRAAHLGQPLSEEHRRNIAAANLGKKRRAPNSAVHRADGTTEIQLTRGKHTIIDSEDWPLVSQHRWHSHRGKNTIWYVRTKLPVVDGKCRALYLHQLLMPACSQVDHRDRDGLNNRRSNLRSATDSQNNFNRRSSPHSSRFVGVMWIRKKERWQARLAINGRNIYLGSFRSELEAAVVRRLAECVYFGDFDRHPS